MQSVGLGAILVVAVGVERRNRVLRSSSNDRATKRAESL